MFLQLSPALRIEGNAAILDAHYARFDNCGVPASVGGGSMDCAGNDLVLAPHFSGYGAVSYEVPVAFGTIFARADMDHRSTVYFEPTNSRSEEHTSELPSLMRISYAVFFWKTKITPYNDT